MRNAYEQLETLKRTLENGSLDRSSPVLPIVLKWVREFPGELGEEKRTELKTLICRCFGLTEDELLALTLSIELPPTPVRCDAAAIEKELYALLPKNGFFSRYVDYTRHSEAPLAYHFFCACVGVGATVNRRVWFDMGYYRLYPSLGIVLLGPSGLKKTTAANIIVSMVQELQITKVYSEKLTPEALVEAMKDMSQGLVYAPEMAVFLGRQRYNEGLVPLITRLMDCPDVWTVETIGRGGTTLRNVALSSLMCSTLDWFISNTPEDTFGGGFIARNLLIVQEDSPRIEPVPRPGDPNLRDRLMQELARLHASFEGEMIMAEGALRRYKDWYGEHKRVSVNPEHELLATYYQRKPDHIKRLAMCMHLAEHKDLMLCVECFERAVAIVDWTEKFLPGVLKQMFKTPIGVEQEYVLRVVISAKGAIAHSDLVRRVQYRMNATQLRGILNSLMEAKQIKEVKDKLHHGYIFIGGDRDG